MALGECSNWYQKKRGVLLKRPNSRAYLGLIDDVIRIVDTPNVLILIVASLCCLFFFPPFFFPYLLLTYEVWALEYLLTAFQFFFLISFVLNSNSDGNLLIHFAWPALP